MIVTDAFGQLVTGVVHLGIVGLLTRGKHMRHITEERQMLINGFNALRVCRRLGNMFFAHKITEMLAKENFLIVIHGLYVMTKFAMDHIG